MTSYPPLCRVVIDVREVGEPSLYALRLRLIGDTLRRYLELFRSRRVLVGVATRARALDSVGDQSCPPLPTPSDLAIPCPDALLASPDVARCALGGDVDYLLQPTRSLGNGGRGSNQRVVRVEAVSTSISGAVAGSAVGIDPAALRLALLRVTPAQVFVLSAARLHRAEETLQRWRYKVAMWADMPGAPPVEPVVNAARESLAAPTLDTGAVLTSLHRLEAAPAVASGSKFETFAFLDRVLGLDLTHLVGKLRR